MAGAASQRGKAPEGGDATGGTSPLAKYRGNPPSGVNVHTLRATYRFIGQEPKPDQEARKSETPAPGRDTPNSTLTQTRLRSFARVPLPTPQLKPNA